MTYLGRYCDIPKVDKVGTYLILSLSSVTLNAANWSGYDDKVGTRWLLVRTAEPQPPALCYCNRTFGIAITVSQLQCFTGIPIIVSGGSSCQGALSQHPAAPRNIRT